jgi:D-alanyl-lipoteichoic acid acyltransferase DltB (MBOAT superfamily)
MFGINLTDNFKRPLFAQNVAMFWQRWHISLSGWCNDYIFNRILINHIKWKKWAAVYGVFVTFFIIGIWHGGRWTYIILGILQGIAINYEFFTKRLRIRLVNKLSKKIVVLFSRLITFHFIGFTIMLFYSKSISNSIAFISNIFSPWDLHDFKKILAILNDIEIIIILVGITLVLLIDYAHENEIKVREEYLRNRNVRHVLVIMLFLIVIFLGNLQSTEFVYLNF